MNVAACPATCTTDPRAVQKAAAVPIELLALVAPSCELKSSSGILHVALPTAARKSSQSPRRTATLASPEFFPTDPCLKPFHQMRLHRSEVHLHLSGHPS